VTRIDFYILASTTADARLTLACRLAGKAFELDHTVFINAADAAEAATLDDLLWTFSQGSFIPHRVVGRADTEAGAEPVLIAHDREPLGDRWDFMINLADDVPEFFSRYARVAEVVDAETQRRERSRERFRYYRDRGYELVTHQL
jgi:DNA polymerase-3 subunit chi